MSKESTLKKEENNELSQKFLIKKTLENVTIVYLKNENEKNSSELNDKDFIVENDKASLASSEDTKKNDTEEEIN